MATTRAGAGSRVSSRINWGYAAGDHDDLRARLAGGEAAALKRLDDRLK